MTDFSLPGGFCSSTPTPTRPANPPPAPARNRLATAAVACIVLFFLGVGLAIVLHPNIPGALLVTLAVLPVAAIVLGALSRPRPQRVGRRRAHIAIKVGAGIVIVLLGISILLPSLCRPREGALVAKCHSNLANICASLFTYADAHNGAYPPSLDALITDPAVNMPASLLVCPASNDSPAIGATPAEVVRDLHSETYHQSYVYIPPTAATLAGDGVVVYERPENHRHTHLHVLFRSGEIRFLTKKEADVLIPDLARIQDDSRGGN